MRYRSKKRAKIERAVSQDRKAFIAEHLSCAVPGCDWRRRFPAVLDVHEVIRGGRRVAMIQDRRAWLCVCRHHNGEMHDLTKWPNELQFGLKMLQDAAFYDLSWLNEQRGCGSGYLQAEVDEALTEYMETAYRS